MNRISDFKTRLEEMLNERQIKAAQLCRDSGVNKTTISQYLKGVYEPKRDQLCRIAGALEVTPEWLEGYDTTKYVSDMPQTVCRIPVYAMTDLDTPLRYEVCDPVHKDCFFVEADDHLYPTVNVGDLVLVDKAEFPEDGQAALLSYRNYFGLYICRRCADGLELCCLNAYYPPVMIPRDELHLMNMTGRVVLTIRKW